MTDPVDLSAPVLPRCALTSAPRSAPTSTHRTPGAPNLAFCCAARAGSGADEFSIHQTHSPHASGHDRALPVLAPAPLQGRAWSSSTDSEVHFLACWAKRIR